MALKILETCINCDMCEPECPNQAISYGTEVYQIDPERCTECVGHYDEPTCVKVCPIDVVVKDPAHPDDEPALWARFDRLHGG